jgi:uncharacterized hydrophobic protein (TIGR00271 family)
MNASEEQQDKTELKKGIRNYFSNLFDIRGDMMSYEEIDVMMQENTVIHGSNMWILILAMLIASIGLYNNSVAVIIGAMLISPLMNGILTMGYSLGVRDLSMLGQAFKRFATQVVISLVASTLFFMIARLDEPTAEMIARTSPTFWDVLIALFGGIAGIIGNTRQKKGNVIPGVAIATALMPPLCTCGYGIATLQPKFIFGALYLFLINALLIGLSACIVTNILKIPNHVQLDVKKQKKINRLVAFITVLVVVPSLLTGAYTLYSAHIDNNIEQYIENEFTFKGTQVVQSSINKEKKTISIALVGTPISDESIEVLGAQLSNYGLGEYSLTITQNSLLDTGDNSDKITIAVQENTIKDLQQQLADQQEKLDELESSLAAKVDFNAIADKANVVFADYLHTAHCGVLSDQGKEYFIMMAHHKKQLTEDEVKLIENWLKIESGSETVMLYTYD